MKLFGLVETMNISGWFHPITIQVNHRDLFNRLEAYDSNLTIGLEPPHTKKSMNFPHMKSVNRKIHLDLHRFFKSRGHKIYLLGSMPYLIGTEKYADRAHQYESELKKIDKKLKRSGHSQPELEQKKNVLKNELDKIHIEMRHRDLIGKEGPMWKNLIRYKPDLVFLGDAHAARFYKRKEELAQHGIAIEEYWHDVVVKNITSDDVRFAASACDEHVPMEHYLEDGVVVELKKVESVEDVSDMLNDSRLSYIQRLFKAMKEGRITDGMPHFTGTWNTELYHRGLFEIFVDSTTPLNNGTRAINGTIEDCAGSATFTGDVRDGQIQFVKTYTKAIDRAAKGEIFYTGQKNEDDTYVGHYKRGTDRGQFWMKQLRDF